MAILSSISKGLGFWSVNHISIYEKFELSIFWKIKFTATHQTIYYE